MFKKLSAIIISASLAFVGLVATATPAQAVPAGSTGSLYYVGGWKDGNWTGIRSYNLLTGEDFQLDLDSPTCAGLASSSTTGIAADIPRKRLYWTANDGVAGVFAMDLANGTCYTIQNGGSPRGVVFSADGETILWSERTYDQNRGIEVQQLRTNQVADLAVASSPNAVNGQIDIEISGYHDISISDLEMKDGRMYALMNLTDDADLSTKNFIYSFDPTSLADPAVLESDTGVIGTPYQFQIGTDAYYVSTFDQIYKIDFGSPGASWGMMLDQVAGFALVGDDIYSAFYRDMPLSVFNPTTDSDPRPISSNPPIDMFSYITYGEPLTIPVITAESSDIVNGTSDVPFSGVTIATNEIVGYSVVPRDGSAPFGGKCVISGSICQISGLDPNKVYDVTLRYAYTYENPNEPANQTHVIIVSAPSNSVPVYHLDTPTITTPSVQSSNGSATLGFGNVTLGADHKLSYNAVPRDGSPKLGGYCEVTGTTCLIAGLDSLKDYDVTLTNALTYVDPNDQLTKILFESASSNAAAVLKPTVTPDPGITERGKKSIKTVTGFEFEKGALTTATKKAIRAWLAGKTGFTKVTCVGYTGYNYNKRSKAYLTKLALSRATNVCNYIHTLRPNIVVKSKTAKLDTSKKSATRRVVATINN
jgi:hypothetical protein